MSWQGRSVFVTGGQGFLGAWLCRALLEAGARVTVLQRDEPSERGLRLQRVEESVNLVTGDLVDGELQARVMGEYEVDTVFHLAAQTIVGIANRSPASTFDANIRGTWTLLEASRLASVERVVVASSDKAYGAHDELPYREDFALQPTFPYDVSKAATDLIARSYWHTFGLPVAVTRLANLYGGGDLNHSRLIPEAVSAVLAGRSPVIRSDGSPERDFLYVEDGVAAYLAIADALDQDSVRGEAFNAGGDKSYSVGEVVGLICEIAGSRLEPDIRGTGSPPGEIDRQLLDSTKIRETCGWAPEVALAEGIRRTVDWYRAHPEARAP